MKALHYQEALLNGLVFDMRYDLQYCHFLRFETDFLFFRHRPSGHCVSQLQHTQTTTPLFKRPTKLVIRGGERSKKGYILTFVQHGTLCLANQAGPGLQYGKQPMDEDCLFLDVYAPTNATTDSKLPVMVFIQGGGWSSDSNGNFNGSLLVENSGMNMIVVTLNYRVGLLGSLASKEVAEGGSLNNGYVGLTKVQYNIQLTLVS